MHIVLPAYIENLKKYSAKCESGGSPDFPKLRCLIFLSVLIVLSFVQFGGSRTVLDVYFLIGAVPTGPDE